ncbi:uncharacterized protein RAG0_16329 [Rhynchosporium agropyri]|uniref:Uncharacterized protein n=1 Tax=Rhynchosporium agropyri TaxID=914238 RepID=A0A1E1LQ03_9HELO|nr:uncharacterized protein RAG0_16329 [Rhynchosporium agropyri]
MASTSIPGENFEVRQTSATEDWHPEPSKSLPLDKARQALVDDIIALYSCEPTIERVKRYTPDCVYDDQFVYANDRYKMAGQWFALPKLFKESKNEGYEVVRSDDEVIQFKNEQSWTFKVIPKTATINALVTLSLDPETVHSDFIRVKYHKDQANDKDYSHEGLGFTFKKWQADQVAKHMDSKEVEYFEADKTAGGTSSTVFENITLVKEPLFRKNKATSGPEFTISDHKTATKAANPISEEIKRGPEDQELSARSGSSAKQALFDKR